MPCRRARARNPACSPLASMTICSTPNSTPTMSAKVDLAQQMPDLPRLDTARVLTVAVKDRAGRPVPFAPVELACADGSRLNAEHHGRWHCRLLPRARPAWQQGLGPRLAATDLARGQLATARRAGRPAGRLHCRASGASRSRKLDLMLVIDTTGSMGDEIRYLQSELQPIVGAIRQRHQGIDLRVGFVFYRDVGDDYVTSTFPLTARCRAGPARARAPFRERRGRLSRSDGTGADPRGWAGAGGPMRSRPCCWSPMPRRTTTSSASPGARPNTCAPTASTSSPSRPRASRDKAEYAMRAMAAATQSRYTFLTDDSGIGNAARRPGD